MEAEGARAEHLAAAYLVRQGLELLQRNYRCRFGEIDLIMREADTLVFVEVRLRSRTDYGGAAASITAAKQQKLVRAAKHYLAGRRRWPPCRFDAVLLSGTDCGSIEWIKNAFGE